MTCSQLLLRRRRRLHPGLWPSLPPSLRPSPFCLSLSHTRRWVNTISCAIPRNSQHLMLCDYLHRRMARSSALRSWPISRRAHNNDRPSYDAPSSGDFVRSCPLEHSNKRVLSLPSCAHTRPAWRCKRRPSPSRTRLRDYPRHVGDTLVILLAWFYGYISAGKLESSNGGVGGSTISASMVSCRQLT